MQKKNQVWFKKAAVTEAHYIKNTENTQEVPH